jgi:O-antigen ligase
LAVFAVVAAFISAVVSVSPKVAILKSLSVLALFLYAASGARLALLGREATFIKGLQLASEGLVYVSAVLYLIFHFPFYGNPNSLGGIMGLVFVPVLAWTVLTCDNPRYRRRCGLALLLGTLLLLFSQARAGIVAGAVSCFLLCLAMRRYRWMTIGTLVALGIAMLSLAITPEGRDDTGIPIRLPGASLTSHFLYKGQEDAGVLSSRKTTWQESTEAIQKHPWFGSGFGTTWVSSTEGMQFAKYYSPTRITREHGNSYLALAEWVGLLGASPFAGLLLLIVLNVLRVLGWLRSGGDPRNPMVPIAFILAAGLIHAGFEDWLLAVGYYLSVFFWVLAFGFLDLTRAGLPPGTRNVVVRSRILLPRPLPAAASPR